MPKKPLRKRTLKDGKWYSVRGVELSRNDGWWTESEFWARIRSCLRGLTRFWKPKLRYLESKSRPYVGKDKRIKKEYQCEECLSWVVRGKIEMDHIHDAGSLKGGGDVEDFIERLFIEYDGGWRCLCKSCHKIKTHGKESAIEK